MIKMFKIHEKSNIIYTLFEFYEVLEHHAQLQTSALFLGSR